MFGRGIATLTFVAVLLSTLAAGEAAAKSVLGGKVFFSPTKPTDSAPKALTKLFAKSKPQLKLKQNAEKEWTAFLAAFFRRPAVNGPITIWFYEQGDKAAIKAKEPVHIMSTASAATVLAHDLLLRSDDGFNKGKSYHVWVGQIIGKRERIYARGLVTLE